MDSGVELKNRTLNLHNLNETVVDIGAVVGVFHGLVVDPISSANLQFK